ncbi:hypothetical protein NQD34_014660 [Periophthalmus magnuspinnatus]|nr:hypothetical protein NQD34_014660 [Periophthalmus magnuspinnatus]
MSESFLPNSKVRGDAVEHIFYIVALRLSAYYVLCHDARIICLLCCLPVCFPLPHLSERGAGRSPWLLPCAPAAHQRNYLHLLLGIRWTSSRHSGLDRLFVFPLLPGLPRTRHSGPDRPCVHIPALALVPAPGLLSLVLLLLMLLTLRSSSSTVNPLSSPPCLILGSGLLHVSCPGSRSSDYPCSALSGSVPGPVLVLVLVLAAPCSCSGSPRRVPGPWLAPRSPQQGVGLSLVIL